MDLAFGIGSEALAQAVRRTHVREVNLLLAAPASRSLDGRFPCLRLVSCGGAPLGHSALLRAQRLFGSEFFQSYGMTECCGPSLPSPPVFLLWLLGVTDCDRRSGGRLFIWLELTSWPQLLAEPRQDLHVNAEWLAARGAAGPADGDAVLLGEALRGLGGAGGGPRDRRAGALG